MLFQIAVNEQVPFSFYSAAVYYVAMAHYVGTSFQVILFAPWLVGGITVAAGV
jgi:ferritin